jgi:prepilin-type N-terminal cleavage/methylation domain-containing protein
MRKGFTLLELLIVVIIVGILASIAIPQFLNAVEKGRVAKAKNALGLIAHAQKMYRAEMDTYVSIDPNDINGSSGGGSTTLGDFVELTAVDEDQDWVYTSEDVTAETFTIVSTKAQGAHEGEFIKINEKGQCWGDHTLRGRDCGVE